MGSLAVCHSKHMHGYSRLRANEEMSKSSPGSISRCSLLRQTDKVKWQLEAIHTLLAFVNFCIHSIKP